MAGAFPAQPVEVSASASFVPELTGPNRLVDHSGLSGDRHDDHPLGHTMWLTRVDEGAPNPAGVAGIGWVAFDFGVPRDLLEVAIWNYNQRGLVDRGVSGLAVSYSSDGLTWFPLAPADSGVIPLAAAPGLPDLAPTDVVPLGVQARYVLLTAHDNFGSEYVGLSEVRFTASDTDCAPPAGDPLGLSSAEVHPEYDRLHPLAGTGWLGGDIAHSVPIDDVTSVWLFGDTFYGTSTDGVRDAAGWGFANGSVGIHHRVNGTVDYSWGSDPTGVFAYQGPPAAGSYYWTTNGIALDGELFVFAMNVTNLFEQRGVTVIRVPNPLDPPEAWVQEHTFVDVGTTTRMFHSGLAVDGPWLYLLGFDDDGGLRRTVLARVTVEAVKRGLTASDYEYWTHGASGPEWSADNADLVVLIDEGSTESHVYFDEALGRFLHFVVTLDGEIRVTSAEALTGPWTPPACVYRAPEVTALDIPLFVYAARPHPELAATPGEVVISYMTNSAAGLGPLFEVDGQNVYRPRLVRLMFEVPATEVTDAEPTDVDGGTATAPTPRPRDAPDACGCTASASIGAWWILAAVVGSVRRNKAVYG